MRTRSLLWLTVALVAVLVAGCGIQGAPNFAQAEHTPFPFTDLDGQACQATFEADVLPLFTQAGVWYDGSPPCIACHNKNMVGTQSNAGMSLETYEDILAGSYRSGPDAQGNDILGGGNWEQSILYDRLVARKDMPLGRPADSPDKGLEILAGAPVGEEQ